MSAYATLPPAVVLGGAGAALSIVRSLGRRGIAVHVLGDAETSLAGASRFCAEFVDVKDGDGDELWLDWLRDRAPSGAVVLPCGDHGLELVATHRDTLLEWGLRPAPTAGPASLAMLDKQRTYEIARAADLSAPATWVVTSPADLDEIAGELTYPCALKPLHSHRFSSHFDFKVFVAEDLEHLRDALALTREHDLEMLVTEIVPGGDDRIWSLSTFLDDAGEPLFQLTRRKIRCHPIHFGVGTYHVTEWAPDVAATGLRFLRAAGVRGMAHVEFKRDERDESLRLIECNHRFVAANEVLRRAGVDVARLAYDRALDQPAEVGQWRSGVWLWSPLHDFRSARAMRAEGELNWPRWIASLLRHPLYVTVLAVDDLGPSIANSWRRARNRSTRVGRRALRRLRVALAGARS